MCNPAVIPMIAQGIQLGGQAFGGMSQAGASQQSYESNAAIKRVQAQDSLNRGNVAVNLSRMAGRERIGQQTAAMGASGVEVGSGSSGDVLAQTAGFNKYEEERLRSDAMREAWGYTEEAKQLEYMAEQSKKQKEAYKTLLFGGLSSDKLMKQINPGINKYLAPGQYAWMSYVNKKSKEY